MNKLGIIFGAILMTSSLAFVACGKKDLNFAKQRNLGASKTKADGTGSVVTGQGSSGPITLTIDSISEKAPAGSRVLIFNGTVNGQKYSGVSSDYVYDPSTKKDFTLVNSGIELDLNKNGGLYSSGAVIPNGGTDIYAYLVAKCASESPECKAMIVSFFAVDKNGKGWTQNIGLLDTTGSLANEQDITKPGSTIGVSYIYKGYVKDPNDQNAPDIISIEEAEKQMVQELFNRTGVL